MEFLGWRATTESTEGGAQSSLLGGLSRCCKGLSRPPAGHAPPCERAPSALGVRVRPSPGLRALRSAPRARRQTVLQTGKKTDATR